VGVQSSARKAQQEFGCRVSVSSLGGVGSGATRAPHHSFSGNTITLDCRPGACSLMSILLCPVVAWDGPYDPRCVLSGKGANGRL
jgi:hypothetical protein